MPTTWKEICILKPQLMKDMDRIWQQPGMSSNWQDIYGYQISYRAEKAVTVFITSNLFWKWPVWITLVWTILIYNVVGMQSICCGYLTSAWGKQFCFSYIREMEVCPCCFSCRQPFFSCSLCPVHPGQRQKVKSRIQWPHELCGSKL